MRNFALGARGLDVLMRRLTLNMLLSFAQFEREIAFSVLASSACARIRPSYRTSPSIGWGIVQR